MTLTQKWADPAFVVALRWATRAPRRIDGAIEADVADVPALVGRAIGLQPQTSAKNTAWNWSSEPFGAGLLGKFAGRVTLKVARADVLPQVTARQFNAHCALGKDELSLEDVTAELAGGRLSGRIRVPAAPTTG